jgi:purine-cytosine permease-like protein
MFPKQLSRTQGTIIAGLVCTVAGTFPRFAMQLLDFVGIYGTILAPIGAVIVVEHFFAKRTGIVAEYAEKTGTSVNLAVLLAWGISVGIAMLVFFNVAGAESFHLPLPAWIVCGALYIVLSKMLNRQPVAQ